MGQSTHELNIGQRFADVKTTNSAQECACCGKTFTALEVKIILAKFCAESHWLKGTGWKTD